MEEIEESAKSHADRGIWSGTAGLGTREKATDVTATDTNMSGMTFKRSLTAHPIDKLLALPTAALSDCTQEGHWRTLHTTGGDKRGTIEQAENPHKGRLSSESLAQSPGVRFLD